MMSEEQIPVTALFNKKGNIAGTYSFQDEYGKYLNDNYKQSTW